MLAIRKDALVWPVPCPGRFLPGASGRFSQGPPQSNGAPCQSRASRQLPRSRTRRARNLLMHPLSLAQPFSTRCRAGSLHCVGSRGLGGCIQWLCLRLCCLARSARSPTTARRLKVSSGSGCGDSNSGGRGGSCGSGVGCGPSSGGGIGGSTTGSIGRRQHVAEFQRHLRTLAHMGKNLLSIKVLLHAIRTLQVSW
jgi:hypothetical protein